MRRHFLSLFLILAMLTSAAAQVARVDNGTPSVERLRAHISHLASDKMEGRRTGSPGANLAAAYIAGEFARYGLRRGIGHDRPGMSRLEADSPARYMQEFPFIAGVELGKNNSMTFAPSTEAARELMKRTGSLDLRLGEDWMPLGFSASANLTNLPVTFVGYGIKVDELNYDDYAGVQVANRIAIALASTPDGDNPHGQFARHGDVRWKAIAARDIGAKALIIITSEENFKNERLSQLRYDNSAGEAGLPVVVISRQSAARIFEAGGMPPLIDMEHAARERFKTLSQSTPAAKKNASMLLEGMTLSVRTDIVRRNAAAYNVVGILEGSDPVLKKEAVVIGAHYDHLGRGGEGSLASREGGIHHGADDNASGVAGMLELARIFSGEQAHMKRTLIFIAFGGEEEGLLGSRFYVNQPVWPLGQTVAMINMDMVGRMKENRLMIGGVGTAQEWRSLINDKNILAGVKAAPNTTSSVFTVQPFTLTLNEDGYGPSDHSSFYAKQIPVLFFFTGTHDDYHKPTDTAEKINYDDEKRILSFVANIVRSIDESTNRPTYIVARSQSQGRSMGFRVYLGTIPSYAESNDGMKLDGVREDSPAAKAGLLAGDRIIKMAGREIRNVYDYTYALGEMKAGQEYEVEVVRGNETLKLKITPTARK